MAYPVVYNAQGVTAIVTQVAGNAGDLLHETGVLADASLEIGADYIALEAYTAGGTTPVCTAGLLYDSDAPFNGGAPQYLGTAGAFSADNTLYAFMQYLGRALNTRTCAFTLLPVDPAIQELRAVADFLLSAVRGPSLTELLAEFRRSGDIR